MCGPFGQTQSIVRCYLGLRLDRVVQLQEVRQQEERQQEERQQEERQQEVRQQEVRQQEVRQQEVRQQEVRLAPHPHLAPHPRLAPPEETIGHPQAPRSVHETPQSCFVHQCAS
jgi:hypothetical protein